MRYTVERGALIDALEEAVRLLEIKVDVFWRDLKPYEVLHRSTTSTSRPEGSEISCDGICALDRTDMSSFTEIAGDNIRRHNKGLSAATCRAGISSTLLCHGTF